MTTIPLHLPRMHSGQAQIARESKRFNVLSCGRRYGKTTLLQEMLIRPALDGYPVGYFAPNYNLLLESWRSLNNTLKPIMKRTNANEHRMELITGGMLDFWTLDNPDAGRSRKYKRVIIDEAGLVKRLMEAWHAAIRPTLADLAGDAWLAGTPKGRNGFWELWSLGSTDPSWAHWQMPTDANPFIPRDEILAMRASMPALVVAQEVDAEFTEGELTLFAIADIDRAAQPYDLPSTGQWLTTVDVGRRRDATVINTFDISQRPYRRVDFDRLERVPYPLIQQHIEAQSRRWPGALVIESNGVGDPLIENLDVQAEPFITTARSKLQALQALQLLFEQGNIAATWDARERAALIGCSWDEQHTPDEIMSLAIFASVVMQGMEEAAAPAIGGQRPHSGYVPRGVRR
jgi:hypothetical protein